MPSSANLSLPGGGADTSAEFTLAYRTTPAELARVADLMRLLPAGLSTALDIGARDGFLSRALAQQGLLVTALDLERPVVTDPRVTCVKGDATALQFGADSIDLVFCAEVIEHIPAPALQAACKEMARVARRFVLIGVPYRQDLRHGRTTCAGCGGINPPWAHVNAFDEARLASLFPSLKVVAISLVGQGEAGTNAVSAALLNFAGNPYGTYIQDETCIHCHARLLPPPPRSLAQKVATKAALALRGLLIRFERPRANWIHVLFEKPAS